MWYERRWETVTGAGPEPGAWGGSAEVPARPRVVAVLTKRFMISLCLPKAWSPSCYSLDNSIGNKLELFIFDINWLPVLMRQEFRPREKQQSITRQGRGAAETRKIIILERGKGLDTEERAWEKLCFQLGWIQENTRGCCGLDFLSAK